jgi:hypothetical protein
MREVVTGKIHKAYLDLHPDVARIAAVNFLPSVLPLPRKGFTDMSHSRALSCQMATLIPTRSLEWRAQLTLGGDKPVIPGVAFIR